MRTVKHSCEKYKRSSRIRLNTVCAMDHNGTMVSAIASQQEGPSLDSGLDLGSGRL